MLHLQLFARFVLVSVLAFGGGQAALPLVERVAVQETGWISPASFGAAVAFGYLTPGPVLIIAAFVGHQVAGWSGALVATLGVFAAPWGLAALAAQEMKRYLDHPRVRAFGAGATPAVVGLLGVTVVSLARDAFVAWPYMVITAGAATLSMWTRLHPVILLGGGALAGWLLAQR